MDWQLSRSVRSARQFSPSARSSSAFCQVKSKNSVGRRQNYEIARPDYECSDHVKKHSSVRRRGRKSQRWAIFGRNSSSERLRFTSSVAEFTAATWTTGCRRNASSRKSTTRATMEGRRRNDVHINRIVLAIAKTFSHNKLRGKSHVENQFQ